MVTCWERADLLALVGDVFFGIFLMWYPRSGVVLDCIVSCSLSSFVLFLNFEFQYLLGFQGKKLFGDM